MSWNQQRQHVSFYSEANGRQCYVDVCIKIKFKMNWATAVTESMFSDVVTVWELLVIVLTWQLKHHVYDNLGHPYKICLTLVSRQLHSFRQWTELVQFTAIDWCQLLVLNVHSDQWSLTQTQSTLTYYWIIEKWKCEVYAISSSHSFMEIDQTTDANANNIGQLHCLSTTAVLWPFFLDHPGEPVPEENFWTLWCKGRLTEANTPTIRLDTTPSGLTSVHLHNPPFFYRPDALPASKPTVSKHWRQLAHSD